MLVNEYCGGLNLRFELLSHETRVNYSQDSQPISSGFADAGRSSGGGVATGAAVGVGVVVTVAAVAAPRFSFLLMDAFSVPEAPIDLR